jgi:5-bromo-4-chloroindolyl phosphate hydrolysis protein
MKTKIIPSAIPIYIAAAVWVIFGLFGHLYELSNILLAIALSLAAFFVSRKFLPGRTVEVEDVLTTGNRDIDRKLASSLEAMKRLRDSAASAPSPVVAKDLKRIDEAGRKILSAVAEKHGQYDQVRRFMEYYLPTTDKLITQYRQLSGAGSGQQVKKALSSVENSLDMIALAFEKQLDKLYADEALDIATDVQVLETMMAADGLTDAGIRQTVLQAKSETSGAAGAAAQAKQQEKQD